MNDSIHWRDTEPGENATEERKNNNISFQLAQLSSYPRVQNKIITNWGTDKGRNTIVGLLVDDRDRHNNKVQGFPESVIKTLGLLLELHDKHFKQYKPEEKLWDVI